jgi:hypothetical protein
MQDTLSLKVTIVTGFTPKHPEFDPLGVVDHHLESTRHQSLVCTYVCSFPSLETLSRGVVGHAALLYVLAYQKWFE